MKTRIFLAALLLLAALAPQARAEDALTPEQKRAVDSAIHDYLLNNPEVLIQALKAAQAKREQQAQELARKAVVAERAQLLEDPDAPVGGNPKGDVTIVEFFDYRCPYCKQVQPSLEALLKQDGKLRIVYKEFPILGPASVVASRVAFAAVKQGKYDDFHRAMMAQKGEINDGVIFKVAQSVGLDVEQAKADMKAASVDKIIKRNYALAETLDIQGTPAFIIGNEIAAGAIDIEALKKLVAEARKKKG